MKKFFSIFLVCAMACVFADVAPTFDRVDENECQVSFSVPFAANKSLFEEETEADETVPGVKMSRSGALEANYSSWARYAVDFGMEQIFLRFPQKPAVSQSNTLVTAYAYDHAVMYSFTGYFPSIGNINPGVWFDEILASISEYPYNLVCQTAFQISNGDWIMDYVVHDYVQNVVIKSRAIVTPFNGYIIQCSKPNGIKDYFEYYIDNLWIKCECQ